MMKLVCDSLKAKIKDACAGQEGMTVQTDFVGSVTLAETI